MSLLYGPRLYSNQRPVTGVYRVFIHSTAKTDPMLAVRTIRFCAGPELVDAHQTFIESKKETIEITDSLPQRYLERAELYLIEARLDYQLQWNKTVEILTRACSCHQGCSRCNGSGLLSFSGRRRLNLK
jgi:hypothetical protein